MNYSTLKKTVALSFASLAIVAAANAQTMKKDSMMSTGGTPKVFGGRGQYRTWSVGVNAGITSQFLAIGGTYDYRDFNPSFAYGISIKDQLAHSFGLQLDVMGYGSKVSGYNAKTPTPTSAAGTGGVNAGSFATQIQWTGTISGVVNVATIDFLRRKNSVNFFVSAGAGVVSYVPQAFQNGDQTGLIATSKNGSNTVKGDPLYQLDIPVGAGVKFKLSDRVALNFGYTANFLNGDYFDATSKIANHKDKFSYGYGGLEFSLGSSAKPNLDWVNPVALMYDELYDQALRDEVAALKGRVTNVENAVNDLKKDSDGDGVADQFDKCPNTPAGTVVDGGGCPIKFPEPDTTKKAAAAVVAPATPYSNIQFEFDSSVLRTSSYPVLDATSADLRTAKKTLMVSGFASSEGTAAHNLQLSKDRANSVKTYLVNSGVDAKRLKVKGYGETKPIADNSTEDGRVLNRRVEFKK